MKRKKTYIEKLRDPRWQKRRLERLQQSEFSCLNCGDDSNELHIHHLLYEKGKDPWDYEDNLLLPLCADCHEAIQNTQNNITRIMATYPPDFLGDLHAALCDLENRADGHIFERWSSWMKAARKPKTCKV